MTTAPVCVASASVVMFEGQTIVGGGLFAVVVVVEVLLFVFGSGFVAAAATVAVFVIIVPCASEQLTFATIVIVAEVTPRVGKVTVRLLPVPPQTPPALEEQLTNVS